MCFCSKPDTEYNNWSAKYSKFAGLISISKIHFDSKKQKGLFSVSYMCGGKCGRGYLVYIEKDNEKWVVKNVEDTWIA